MRTDEPQEELPLDEADDDDDERCDAEAADLRETASPVMRMVMRIECR